MKKSGHPKKLVIITGYFKGESYGLLGPQMAATIITGYSDYDAIVAAITNEDDPSDLKAALEKYFDGGQMVVGFSSLGGRPDLFALAGELKEKGAVTILAGPQAGPDYKGETGWKLFDHRFKGLADHFSFALHGPAQQILPVLEHGVDHVDGDISRYKGVLYRGASGEMVQERPGPWDDHWLSGVDWQNIYRLRGKEFEQMPVTCAQVLQQIGCQHAAKEKPVKIDYPQCIVEKGKTGKAVIHQKGCSFCDVAVDKGYMGSVGDTAVKAQLECLPTLPDGSRIAFELINESPLPKLSHILDLAGECGIELSQINLTLRADYFLKGLATLEKTLEIAREKNVRILLGSIGFESFDDTILKNLNKGVTRQMNLDAVKAIRELKQKFPYHFGYLKDEGANHGFIHPTPWDTPEISREINRTISMYRLAADILPSHSTPLIIHHASGLADWIRQIEESEKIRFDRIGTTIAWWQAGKKE